MADICPSCDTELLPQHQHFTCFSCGYIEPCCEGAPGSVVKISDDFMEDAERRRIKRAMRDMCEGCLAIEPAEWSKESLCKDCLIVASRECIVVVSQ